MKWQSKTRCISGAGNAKLWVCHPFRPNTKKKRRRGGLKPYLPKIRVWEVIDCSVIDFELIVGVSEINPVAINQPRSGCIKLNFEPEA